MQESSFVVCTGCLVSSRNRKIGKNRKKKKKGEGRNLLKSKTYCLLECSVSRCGLLPGFVAVG